MLACDHPFPMVIVVFRIVLSGHLGVPFVVGGSDGAVAFPFLLPFFPKSD